MPYLTNDITTLAKLGFIVTAEGRIERKKMAKESSQEDFVYCGFNVYIKDGCVFEKQGSEMVKLDSDELDAEQRFVCRHLSKDA